jgi:hypothetical protein
METLLVERASGETETSPDRTWRGLYQAGGISAALYIVLGIIVPVVILMTMPLPPSSGGVAILQFIASNRLGYIIEQVLFSAPSVFAMVVFLALYMALKHLNKSYAAIAALVAIVSQVLALASPVTGGGALSLVYLSDQYVAATTAAQRAAFASAAEGFIALNTIVGAGGILFAIGILIISIVMLKGVFNKGIAYLGMVTGAVGIISEALRNMLGIGYMVYWVLFVIWFIAIGWKLYRLGLSSSHESVAKRLEGQATS